MGTKAVTFDVVGTLARGGLNQRIYRSKVLDYLGHLGFEVGTEGLQKATTVALEELRKIREKRLEMRFEDFCSRILGGVDVAPTKKILEDMRGIYFDSFAQVERAGARKVLAELSKSHVLGAVSNSMSLAPKRFLERSGLDGYFKVITVSREIGYRKPHPRIFERVIGELGVEPGDAVHVGNSVEEDVAGAKAVGMGSVLVSRKGLKEEEPDLVVGSIREVPLAVSNLSSPELKEIKELLGDRCWFCFTEGINLYKLDPEGADDPENFVPLCPSCRGEVGKFKAPRPRKRGKYRAVYRRAWLKARMAR